MRTRRVLYNFDGDSCLSSKANSKVPVALNVDDIKRHLADAMCALADLFYAEPRSDGGGKP